jgi:hypothetical protein
MANAYVCVRHPDYHARRDLLDDVGRAIHVYAGEHCPGASPVSVIRNRH